MEKIIEKKTKIINNGSPSESIKENDKEEVKVIKTVHPSEHKKDGDKGFNLTLPFIFISVGLILILNNFGILSWNVWDLIWRFWPVILILIGIEILFKGTVFRIFFQIIGLLIVLILSAVLILGLFVRYNNTALTNTGINVPQFIQDLLENNETQTKNNFVAKEKYPELKAINADINISSQTVSMKTKSTENLFEADASYNNSNFEPKFTEDERNGILYLTYETGKSQALGFNSKAGYDLVFGKSQLKTDLNYTFGAGKGNLDLSDINLGDLSVKIGSGTTTVDFGEEQFKEIKSAVFTLGAGSLDLMGLASISGSRFSLEVGTGTADLEFNGNHAEKIFPATLKLGAGTINMKIPKETGFKINYKIGLGTLNYGNFSGKRDGEYLSDNYATSKNKIDIDIVIGAGSLNIEDD